MKTFISNFGQENYLWPACLSRPSVATFDDEDTWPFLLANDREGYIARCIATKKTAKGIIPTRPVASRWFNLARNIETTRNDLWIHREKNELWWTISRSGNMEVLLEPAFRSSKPGERVYVLHKGTDPWSNQNKQGSRLEWSGLHAKAREFLSTEATHQKLSDDNAAYALALIEGRDLNSWHSRPAWRAKAEAAGRGAATTFNAKQRAIVAMAVTARETVAGAKGQEVLRTVKIKELRFGTTHDFEKYIEALIDAQEGLCAVTGLKLQYYGEHDDVQLLCSLDRIDSSGHYEAGNLQIVCRFVNRWKGDQDDREFRRLMSLVRSGDGFG